LQSSKGDTRIYLTAQDSTQNELRIRHNQHKITQCSRRLLIGTKFKKISDEKRELPLKMQEILYICAKTYIQSLRGFERVVKLKHTEYIRAKPLFNLYDTNKKLKHEDKENQTKLDL
jgi:hypothetical protein